MSWRTSIRCVLFELLDEARERSSLPEEPDVCALEAWLIEVRAKELKVA
ncbi:MAG: hypothetical protein JRH20_32150 [Deltaproteobacteria bacterium]|nr:hypothetical protein [Deltaproteobacteria bacterium]